MDEDEEEKQYGMSTAKLAGATLSANQIMKDKAKEMANEVKKIQDFKVRVLDFVAIYIKETKKQPTNNHALESLEIIKGLLKGLQVAHTDRNTILFERIKTVISMMARGPQQALVGEGEEASDDSIKENKIVMTELMTQLLKNSKDQQMLKAYQDCFLLLTKTYYQAQSNQPLQRFLAFTYKELLKNFLGGRMASNAINVKFF